MPELAVVFPGQGSQQVGMGKDLHDSNRAVRAVFEEADSLLGFSISKLCFEGPEQVLNDTVNTQPAIFTTCVALWKAVEEQLSERVRVLAGHSLGEYAALVASGALDLADGLRLVRERGRLMKEAGINSQGGMAAIIGLDPLAVDEICKQAAGETGGEVQVANYNSPGQLVISGDEVGLANALERARTAGARRVVRLAVSIAAHSPLMAPAQVAFGPMVAATQFGAPKIPVIGNTVARPLAGPGDIVSELVAQLTAPVRWTESVLWMIEQGIDTLIEIGPGQVLTGLQKRIDRSVARVNVHDATSVKALAGV